MDASHIAGTVRQRRWARLLRRAPRASTRRSMLVLPVPRRHRAVHDPRAGRDDRHARDLQAARPRPRPRHADPARHHDRRAHPDRAVGRHGCRRPSDAIDHRRVRPRAAWRCGRTTGCPPTRRCLTSTCTSQARSTEAAPNGEPSNGSPERHRPDRRSAPPPPPTTGQPSTGWTRIPIRERRRITPSAASWNAGSGVRLPRPEERQSHPGLRARLSLNVCRYCLTCRRDRRWTNVNRAHLGSVAAAAKRAPAPGNASMLPRRQRSRDRSRTCPANGHDCRSTALVELHSGARSDGTPGT